MSELHEVASKWGVSTHVCWASDWPEGLKPRPDLEIAHDLLSKLPEWAAVHWIGHGVWEYGNTEDDLDYQRGTFPEAVLALAKRAHE